MAETLDKRSGRRNRVLKKAQITFGDAAIDCVVESMSAGGAQVRLGGPMALPEAVALRFRDGGSHAARRCWSHGAVVGLAFTGTGAMAEVERRPLARAAQRAIADGEQAEALRLLREAWFFGDEELRRAAEAAELAQARLAAALAPHVLVWEAPE